MAIHAQDAEFRYHGEVLEDGATITIYGEVDPVWGDIECNTNPSSDAKNGLVFVNKTANELKSVANLTIESNTLNPSMVQWCMGGQCVPVTSTTYSKDFTTAASGLTMVQFDCYPTTEGEMLATIKVTANLKTYTVKIRFVYDPAHIGQVVDDTRKVAAIYTIDGRRVGRQPAGLCLIRTSDGKYHKVLK